MNNKDKKGSKKFNFVSADELDQNSFDKEVVKRDSLQNEKKVVSKDTSKKKKKKNKLGISKQEFIEQREREAEADSLMEENEKAVQKESKKKKPAPIEVDTVEEEVLKESVSEKAEEKEVLGGSVPEEMEEKEVLEESVPEEVEEKEVLEESVSEKVEEKEVLEESVSEKVEEKEVLEESVPEEMEEKDVLEEPVPEEAEEKEPIHESKKVIYNEQEEEVSKTGTHKIYFSFEARVISLVLSIIVLFIISTVLILEAINFGKAEIVTYDEIGNVGYKVCLKNNDYYNDNCLDEGMEYVSSLTDKIDVRFDYNVGFSTEIDYDLSYHVVGVTKIYNKNDNNKMLYQNEDLLVEKTDISKEAETIHLEKNVAVDYDAFNAKIMNYMNQYSNDSAATLEVILYLDEPTETRKISSVTIPLGMQTYAITKSELSNKNGSVKIENRVWDTYHSVCASVGIVLLLVDLLILFKTTKFVLKATAKRDKFHAKLGQILTDYDRLIVVARDGFISSGDKSILKVADFDELLDAQSTLRKPIIYSKINNVKSEFIIEDSDILYKYVMKESDFSE